MTVASELDFVLPEDLQARLPAEARGLRRDQVRLLVSREVTGEVTHTGSTSSRSCSNPATWSW